MKDLHVLTIINLLKLSSEQGASISTNVFIGLVAIYQVSDNYFDPLIFHLKYFPIGLYA